MFGAAQLPVNHKTEDIIITVAPFFSNNWRLLMDEKSESFTLMELWIKLIYKEYCSISPVSVSNAFE